MSNLNTFEGSTNIVDPILQKQKEGVARMRTSLIACSDDIAKSKQAIHNITVMRVYHQIARIIRYTEMMDKLEDKLYESIDATLNSSNVNNPTTWMMLLNIQERLQKSMIESHKLLQPYLDIEEFSVVELTSQASDSAVPTTLAMDADTRDRVRIAAQSVLTELNGLAG